MDKESYFDKDLFSLSASDIVSKLPQEVLTGEHVVDVELLEGEDLRAFTADHIELYAVSKKSAELDPEAPKWLVSSAAILGGGDERFAYSVPPQVKASELLFSGRNFAWVGLITSEGNLLSDIDYLDKDFVERLEGDSELIEATKVARIVVVLE